jgi:hypothetical protein
MILAVHFLSSEEQGWYYSFISVAALYTLFDLGLSAVLVQLTAHAFPGLRWTTPGLLRGKTRRYLQVLIGRSVRWYVLLGVLFVALLVPGGLLFFGAKHASSLQWAAPWVTTCLLTGLSLIALPFLAVLEGSGEVSQVYAVRFLQGVCGSIACWCALASGGGLWATAMAPTMATVIPLGWIFLQKPGLIATALRYSKGGFDWRIEVWPMQWRLGANWLCGYLLTQINIPILFRVQGAIEAGQLGLSLAIVNTLGLFAQSWMVGRIPSMAKAAALRDWKGLDRMFARDFTLSILVFLAGMGALLLAHHLLAHVAFVTRILPFWQFAALMVFALASHLIGGMAAYLRSFRREPFIVLVGVGTLFTVPVILWAAVHYSSAGIVAVLAGSNLLINFPLAFIIWKRSKREWTGVAA